MGFVYLGSSVSVTHINWVLPTMLYERISRVIKQFMALNIVVNLKEFRASVLWK